ncbi:MAG TPA: DUF72 domain-containing protein [Thermoleophilaceae bacterium]|nr:DUF72 domain-containing protein [Thermoleophilaceae bacterium]
MAGRILVGTSSWADPGFVEEWYPEGLPAAQRLPWYARRFEAVEVNSTFYSIPDPGTGRRWVEATPDRFRFDVKLHRALSRHAAPLNSLPRDLRGQVETTERGRVVLSAELEAELVRRLLEGVAPLEQTGRLGALLLQLTPGFSPDRHSLDELDGLVETVKPRRLAVELRHRWWVSPRRIDDTLRWFSDRQVTFVCVDSPPGEHIPILPSIDAVTRDDLAYLRAHGRNTDGYMRGKTVAERFGWRYADEELEEVGGRARGLAEQADEVHLMFNNNRGDDAPTAAQRMRSLLGQDPGPAPTGEEDQLKLGER